MPKSKLRKEQLVLVDRDSGERIDARVQHKPFNAFEKYFTLIIDWDEYDGRDYAWSGFAANLEEAEKLARIDMVVKAGYATAEECKTLDLKDFTGEVLEIYEDACIHKAPLVARRLQKLIRAGRAVDTYELIGLLKTLRPH